MNGIVGLVIAVAAVVLNYLLGRNRNRPVDPLDITITQARDDDRGEIFVVHECNLAAVAANHAIPEFNNVNITVLISLTLVEGVLLSLAIVGLAAAGYTAVILYIVAAFGFIVYLSFRRFYRNDRLTPQRDVCRWRHSRVIGSILFGWTGDKCVDDHVFLYRHRAKWRAVYGQRASRAFRFEWIYPAKRDAHQSGVCKSEVIPHVVM